MHSGRNGAGKSTLMNILFGMPVIHSTGGFEGKVLLDGEETHIHLPLRCHGKGIGMVHQEFMLLPGFHPLLKTSNSNREITNPNPVSRLLAKIWKAWIWKAMAFDARKALDDVGMNLNEKHTGPWNAGGIYAVYRDRQRNRQNRCKTSGI